MKRFLNGLIAIVLLCGCASPADPTEGREIPTTQAPSHPADTASPSITSVLFLGNSYTYDNDLPDLFAELARSGGQDVEVQMVAEGGWRLADHAQSPETQEQLRARNWTYVVLQEQSQIPAFAPLRTREMYPAARELVSQIRSIGATPVFFLTWAHRDGWPKYRMNDYESMQLEIQKGYQEIARELDVPIAPVGTAWLAAVQEHPDLNLWREDGSHPSKQGTYLAACVFYQVIFQESPVGLTYRAGLSRDTAKMLQSVAAETVSHGP
jgi:hypothetical protein